MHIVPCEEKLRWDDNPGGKIRPELCVASLAMLDKFELVIVTTETVVLVTAVV